MSLKDYNEPAWPDPVAFVKPAPSAGMPEGFVGTPIGDLAEEVHTQWGIPHLLTVATALGVAVSATRGRAEVAISSGASFPLALYLAPMANPGSLKSAVLSLTSSSLIAAQRDNEQANGHAVTQARTEAAALREARKKLENELAAAYVGTNPKSRAAEVVSSEIQTVDRRLIALESGGALDGLSPVVAGADLTYEALIKKAERNGGCVALLSAEGGLLENLAGRYNEGAARTEFLNSAFDGEPFDGERVSDTERKIDKPWCSMVLVVQPDLLKTMLGSPKMRNRGFLQRFWLFDIPDTRYRNRHSMPGIDPLIELAWSQSIQGVVDQTMKARIRVDAFGPDSGALVEFEKTVINPAFDTAQRDHNQLLVGWLSKAAMISNRVAATLTLLEDPAATVVTASAARAATGITQAAIDHARYLFAEGARAALLSPPLRVLTWIVATNATTVTTNQVNTRFRGQTWCEDADSARDVLVKLTVDGWLRQVPKAPPTDKGGRPSEKWLVHPESRSHYVAMLGRAPDPEDPEEVI
jgi:hypothetical protein